MKDNKYYLFKNIVVLTYIFLTYVKKVVYLSKAGKENIINFQTCPLLLSH